MIKLLDCLLKYLWCFSLIQTICLVCKLQKSPMYLCRRQYKELSFLKVSFLNRNKKKRILLSSSLEGEFYFPLPLKELQNAKQVKSSPCFFQTIAQTIRKRGRFFPNDASYRHKMYFMHYKY